MAALSGRLQEHSYTGVQISDNTDADIDHDGDGFTENNGDCNDANAAVYPEAIEICGDHIDQDCNGTDPACLPDDDDDAGGP